jgi:hypothetical protein
VVDVGIALLLQAAMTMPFVVPRSAESEPATWPAYGLTTLTVIPPLWRRRAPVVVLLVILVASTLYEPALAGTGQPLPCPGLVIVYTVAVLSPPWKRLVTGLLLLVGVPVPVWLNTRAVRERCSMTVLLLLRGTELVHAWGGPVSRFLREGELPGRWPSKR